jgi:hypothetical protein
MVAISAGAMGTGTSVAEADFKLNGLSRRNPRIRMIDKNCCMRYFV